MKTALSKIIFFICIGALCLLLGVIYQQEVNLPTKNSPSIYSEVLIDIEGNKVQLSQFKGKWLVLNFWATWCEPCREEIPELNQFAKDNTDITLIGIAVDDMEATKNFQKDTPIKYLSLISNMDGVRLSQSLGNIKGVLPFTVVIDSSGNTVRSFYGKVVINELNQAVTPQ
ncbi:MAG: TlpA disulfide reductase family protein [Methylophilaceae bacterium]|jgi:thiol-disulfide isomerase/thioredoxin|nr:TlpA disulfide reductase family protein [Methylophilaceae bacterium]